MPQPPPAERHPLGYVALLAPVLFIAAGAIPLANMGFRGPSAGAPVEAVIHFSWLQLWAINLGLGLVAGVLLVPKRFVLAGIAGLVGTTVVTGTTRLYFSWRESFEAVETLIPLGLGFFASYQLYLFLSARFPISSEE
jgi:hypothetical protein